MKILIQGKPATYSTKFTKPWKEILNKKIPEKGDSDDQDRGVILKFYLSSFTRRGHPIDLDNLVEPVFSVLINKKGYFNGDKKNIQWWFASMISYQNEGVEIEISDKFQIDFYEKISKENKPNNFSFIHIKIVRLCLESRLEIDTIIDDTYLGPIPNSAKSTELPGWLLSKQIKPIGEGDRVSVSLVFPDYYNIGKLPRGIVKPTLDCLYPILGGKAGFPEDWKIEKLWIGKVKFT